MPGLLATSLDQLSYLGRGGARPQTETLRSPLALLSQVSAPSPCFHVHSPVWVRETEGGKKLSNCQACGCYQLSVGFPG